MTYLADRTPRRLSVGRRLDTVCGRDGLPVLRSEVDRARRYEHPVTLLRLTDAGRRRAGHRDLHVAVHHAARAVDTVWCDLDGVLVLMPETSPQQALRGAQRLVPALAGDRRVGLVVAGFPADALTVEGLLDAVRSDRRAWPLTAFLDPEGDASTMTPSR